jgi:hypothetical protein
MSHQSLVVIGFTSSYRQTTRCPTYSTISPHRVAAGSALNGIAAAFTTSSRLRAAKRPSLHRLDRAPALTTENRNLKAKLRHMELHYQDAIAKGGQIWQRRTNVWREVTSPGRGRKLPMSQILRPARLGTAI